MILLFVVEENKTMKKIKLTSVVVVKGNNNYNNNILGERV